MVVSKLPKSPLGSKRPSTSLPTTVVSKLLKSPLGSKFPSAPLPPTVVSKLLKSPLGSKFPPASLPPRSSSISLSSPLGSKLWSVNVSVLVTGASWTFSRICCTFSCSVGVSVGSPAHIMISWTALSFSNGLSKETIPQIPALSQPEAPSPNNARLIAVGSLVPRPNNTPMSV